jgi:hypothetical protein
MATRTVDLHDLSAILLHEWSLTEPRFLHSQLIEVTNGNNPQKALPSHVQLPELTKLWRRGVPVKAYFLQDEEDTEKPPVTPTSFKHADFTSVDSYSDYDFETMYWQTKNHDHGYAMASAMQLVLDALPPNVNLRVRTSLGYSITIPPSEFSIAEIQVIPKEIAYVCRITKQPLAGPDKVQVGQFSTGERGVVPWVYLLFGGTDVASSIPELDGRVALDLAAPLLSGMRGLGKEVFAMERLEDYHNRVLPTSCSEVPADIILSGRIRTGIGAARIKEDQLAKTLAKKVSARVLDVLENGTTSCGYCGARLPKSLCSRCKEARFCNKNCQTAGWKYHRKWCVPTDGAHAPKNVNSAS